MNTDTLEPEDYVQPYADALALSDDAVDWALRVIVEHDFDARTDPRVEPRMFTAGLMYCASIKSDDPRTQGQVADACGVSRYSVSRHARSIASVVMGGYSDEVGTE